MAITPTFDFSDQTAASKALKKIAQLMQRAGQPVVSTSFDAKLKRTSGVSYREAMLTLASGQTVTLRVTQTGDVFQVLLNGSVKPIHQQHDPIKAVGEIAKLADANQAAFQKTLARVKVELPKGVKTAAPRMAEALQARSTELDTQIAERQQQVADLKAELGETALDAVPSGWPRLEADGQFYNRDQYDLVPTDEHGEMPPGLVLKPEAVAVVLDGADVTEAVGLAERVLGGIVLDSADGMAAAVAQLGVALQVVEHNEPINRAQGNIEQADLEAGNAASFRAAIAALDSAVNQDVGDNPPVIAEPEIPKPSHAADDAVAADAKLQYPEITVTDGAGSGEKTEEQEAQKLED